MNNWYFSSHQSFAQRISKWWFIKFRKGFAFPDHDPPVIYVLNRWLGLIGQLGLCIYVFFSISAIFIILKYYITKPTYFNIIHYFLCDIFKIFSLMYHKRTFLSNHVCICLLSTLLKTFLLIFFVDKLWKLLLNLCSDLRNI